MSIQKFRKKPMVIEAIQFDGTLTCAKMICDVFDRGDVRFRGVGQALEDPAFDGGELLISTLEGDMTASPGDWIIRGVKGEVYPCKPDIFEATYELVDDTTSHVVHDVTDAENIDAARFFSALDDGWDDGDDYEYDDGYDDE